MERTCGACMACCTAYPILGIPGYEGAKPAGVRCQHLTATGCGIYEFRPDVCRQYECLWKMGEGRNMERPDRSGFIMNNDGDQGLLFAVTEPAKLNNPAVRDALARYARKAKLIVLR